MATPQLYYKNGNSWQSAMLSNYPVGAIYSSTSSTNPGSIFGGGWVQITGDACLMAGNNATYIGSKKITVEQMPSHYHNPPYGNYFGLISNNPDKTMRTVSPLVHTNDELGRDYTGVWGLFLGETKDMGSLPTESQGGGKTICPTVTVAICGEELHKFGCDVA